MAKVKFNKDEVQFKVTKPRRRTKPKYRRVAKKLGPKSSNRGNKGKY